MHKIKIIKCVFYYATTSNDIDNATHILKSYRNLAPWRDTPDINEIDLQHDKNEQKKTAKLIELSLLCISLQKKNVTAAYIYISFKYSLKHYKTVGRH